MSNSQTSEQFTKILVISLAGIGDTLFATPLIHELHQNFPEAKIEALVMWPGSRDLLEGNPFLTAVHQRNLIRSSRSESLRFINELRHKKFDVSINTHPQSKIHYRIIARLINAPIRISHTYHNPKWLDHLFVNRTAPQDYSKHAVENNFSLLPMLGAKVELPEHRYEIFLQEAENLRAADYLKNKNLTSKKLLGMHVGSGGTKNLAARRWPLENFIELIQRVTKKSPETSILLFGGPEEKRDFAMIQSTLKNDRIFFPETQNIRQAAALLGNCRAFLSVDTALMHLAAAMKVPHQFVIETPTWNKVIEPYGNPFTLIPNPAVAGRNLEFYRYDGRNIQGSEAELKRCMQSVTVDAVEKELRKAI